MSMAKLAKLVKKLQTEAEKMNTTIQSLTDLAENSVDENVSKAKVNAAESAGDTLKRKTRQAKVETVVSDEAPKQRRRRRTKAEIEAEKEAMANKEPKQRKTRQAKVETVVSDEAPKQRRRRTVEAQPVISPRNKRSAFAESVL